MTERWLEVIQKPESYSEKEVKGTLTKLESMIAILDDESESTEKEFKITLRRIIDNWRLELVKNTSD